MSPLDLPLIREDVTLAILAGGEGSRMGQAKGLLKLNGRPILQYLLDQLSWPGPTLLVTAPGREHPPGWERFGREVSDPEKGGGPLRGVLTALEHVRTPLLLVLTVDMPGICSVHCEILLNQLQQMPAARGAMFTRLTVGGSQIEPFPFALRFAAIEDVCRRLTEHRRSVHGLLDEPGFFRVQAPTPWDATTWTNLNFPSDMEAYKGESTPS